MTKYVLMICPAYLGRTQWFYLGKRNTLTLDKNKARIWKTIDGVRKVQEEYRYSQTMISEL